jgi:N-acetylmuramoyl-L-alanine amidase
MLRPIAVVALCLVAAVARAEAPSPRVTVVLDPGHGGSNLGAAGAVAGVYEKKLTLALGRLVRRALERDGVRVVATRDSDTYLTLGERVRRANAAGADAFVSLHANATPEHQRRGFYAYILSREVSDVEARKASERAPDPAEATLSRARVRELAQESARLAEALRTELGKVREADHGTRQAPFDVLEGLRMPAALLEVGFIDHEEEGVELLQPEVLRRLADAIASGIETFARGVRRRPADEAARH